MHMGNTVSGGGGWEDSAGMSKLLSFYLQFFSLAVEGCKNTDCSFNRRPLLMSGQMNKVQILIRSKFQMYPCSLFKTLIIQCISDQDVSTYLSLCKDFTKEAFKENQKNLSMKA